MRIRSIVASATLTTFAIGAFTVNASAIDSATPTYVVSTNSAVTITPFATSGDTIGGTVLRGTPDGLGAMANADGTITLFSNHEISTSQPEAVAAAKDSGVYSSSVSKIIYNPTTNAVTSVSPLVKSISYYSYILDQFTNDWHLSFPVSTPYKDSYGAPLFTNGLSRFCSSNLAPAGTFSYSENVTTKVGKKTTTSLVKYGYDGAVYFTGEESGDWSRYFAINMDGQAIQLPRLGLASWENYTPAPASATKKKTVMLGDEDGSATSSQLYMYVGTKQSDGATFADKAGLQNGDLYVLNVPSAKTDNIFRTEIGKNKKTPANFTKIGWNPDKSGTTMEAQIGGSTFARIEDGEFDPNNPNVYYFLTTESNKDAGATASNPATPTVSRDGGALWRFTFTDVANPTLGGQLEMLLNGTETPLLGKPDNLTVDPKGYLILQEDPGNNDLVSRLVAYRISDGKMAVIGQFDEQYFKVGASKFITKDEESSGVISITSILNKGDGASYFMFDAQVHAPIALSRPDLAKGANIAQIQAEAVEGGQYYLMKISDWATVFAG
ncbi:MAG: alkaline phosphatase PhoX [Actinomycetes bacterium]